MKKKFLFALLAAPLLTIVLTIGTGFGGPTSADIQAGVNEKLSRSIELSELTINRIPRFVLSADQLIVYSADAVITEDYVRQLNPFEWQEQCEGGREGRTVNADLAGTAVHEVIATKGSALTLFGKMKAYRENGDWQFTARTRRLMNSETRISGTPVSAVDNVLLTQSAEFSRLCQSTFQG